MIKIYECDCIKTGHLLGGPSLNPAEWSVSPQKTVETGCGNMPRKGECLQAHGFQTLRAAIPGDFVKMQNLMEPVPGDTAADSGSHLGASGPLRSEQRKRS